MVMTDPAQHADDVRQSKPHSFMGVPEAEAILRLFDAGTKDAELALNQWYVRIFGEPRPLTGHEMAVLRRAAEDAIRLWGSERSDGSESGYGYCPGCGRERRLTAWVDGRWACSEHLASGATTPFELVLVLFECDPNTNEALGAVHAFCSERCRDEFATDFKPNHFGAVYVRGTDYESQWGFAPKCESCGCPWNWRTGPRRSTDA